MLINIRDKVIIDVRVLLPSNEMFFSCLNSYDNIPRRKSFVKKYPFISLLIRQRNTNEHTSVAVIPFFKVISDSIGREK